MEERILWRHVLKLAGQDEEVAQATYVALTKQYSGLTDESELDEEITWEDAEPYTRILGCTDATYNQLQTNIEHAVPTLEQALVKELRTIQKFFKSDSSCMAVLAYAEQVDERQQKLVEIKNEKQRTLWNTISGLKQNVQLIQDQIEQQKQLSSSEVRQAELKAQILQSQMSLLQAELHADLYTPEKLEALTKIRDTLQKTQDKSLQGIQEIESKLHKFETNSKIKALAQEYGELKHSIAVKRSDIASLDN